MMGDPIIEVLEVTIREDRIAITYSAFNRVRIVEPYTIPEPPIVVKPKPQLDLRFRSIWDDE